MMYQAFNVNTSTSRTGPSRTNLLLVFIISLYAISCSLPKIDKATPLARVENHSITRDDLYDQSGVNYISPGEIIERWIDDEVLIHHARGSSIVDQTIIDHLVDEYRQRVSAQLFLDSLILRRTQVTRDGARDYYYDNLKEFQFSDDAAEVIHISFQQLDDAQDAFHILNTTTMTSDSLLRSYNYDHQIVHRRRLIAVLDEAIFSAAPGNLVGPLTSEYGYHLIRVIRHFSAGEPIPIELVQTNIINRLFQKQLPVIRTTVLDSLREVTDVEIHPN